VDLDVLPSLVGGLRFGAQVLLVKVRAGIVLSPVVGTP
jgi:hypothetical protein